MSSPNSLPPPEDNEDVNVTAAQLEQLLALRKELDELMANSPTVTQALAVRRRYEKLWRQVFRGNAGQHARALPPPSGVPERPWWLHTTNVRYDADLSHHTQEE